MSDSSLASPQSLPLSSERRVNDICNRFEMAWRTTHRPSIEDYLAGTLEPERSILLRELIALDIDYRRRAGETPQGEEYRAYLPTPVPAQEGERNETESPTLPRAVSGTMVNGPEIPGYQILGELGRGGMGVVYWAWQTSLNRPVALKMILAGAHAGANALARFQTEAEAVAHLRHPNTVQIYEVGHHDKRPYMALEYVDGGNLAQKLAGAPLPARPAAQLLETLARAVSYAHQRGIIHRDLTPTNVLLTADGVPKITDFGLAKLLAGDSAAPTVTGVVVGTPSYMAPEQARGKSKEVGPAADIYALGAILYEMLTGRPPFRAETPLDTLQQVQSHDPVPPSRLQPKVPRDLATICLTCLQKEPLKRYTSAENLALDLQRFLAGQPIQARPVGMAGRVARWCRRKPAIAALLAGLSLVVAAGFAGVTWQWRRAEGERQRADEQRDRAETSYRLAREGLEECVSKIAENPRLKSGPLEDLRREIMQAELLFYQRFVELRGDEPEFQAERGRAFRRLGKLTHELATREEAIIPYQQALAIFDELCRKHADVPEYRAEKARSYHDLGVQYRYTNRHQDAEQAYREAMAILKVLVHEQPAVRDYRANLSRCLYSLAVLCTDTNRMREAEEAYQESLALCQLLVRDHPEIAADQNDLAITACALGIVYRKTNRLQEAERAYEEAVALSKALVRDHPEVMDFKENLGNHYNSLGALYHDTHRHEEAERTMHQAMMIRQDLVRDHPNVARLAIDLGTTQYNLGYMMVDLGQLESAVEYYTQAIATHEAVFAKEPHHVYAKRLRNPYHRRAQTLVALGRHAEAVPDLDRVVQLSDGNDGWPRLERAVALARIKEHARATAEADALATYRNVSGDVFYTLATVFALSTAAVATDANLTAKYGTRGIDLLRQAVAKGFKDLSKLTNDPDLEALRARADFNMPRAKLLNELSWSVVAKPGGEASAYGRALLQVEEACQLIPDDGQLLNTLGVAQYRLEKYQEAVTTLTHSDQVSAGPSKGSRPEDLTFMAMAHYRLGHVEEAEHFLSRLRETVKQDRWAKNTEAQAFLREAEAVLRQAAEPAQAAPDS